MHESLELIRNYEYHGLTSTQNKEFFKLPIESKLDIAHKPGPNPQRGWSCVGSENSAKLYGRAFKKESAEHLKDARVGRESSEAIPVN